MKKNSLIIVICAVLTALTAAFAFFPFVFLVPALFAACCFSLPISFFASTCFGVISLLLSFSSSLNLYGAVGWYFVTYPWLPVLARMFIGPIIFFLYRLLTNLIKQDKAIKKIIPISIAGAIGSILNTFFVGSLIFLVGSEGLPSEYTNITLTFLALWGLIEAIVVAIILPPIVIAVKKAVPTIFKRMESTKKVKKEENK